MLGTKNWYQISLGLKKLLFVVFFYCSYLLKRGIYVCGKKNSALCFSNDFASEYRLG
jgi:hypothetical protein